MTKDYYKILGIKDNDSSEAIKAAYRKLARKYHPDVAGNSNDAILRFKEINEAYKILSNKVKKEEYDRMRRFYSYAKESSYTSKQTQNNTTNPQTKNFKKDSGFKFNWEDFISKKNRANSFHKTTTDEPKRGSDIHTEIEISIFEAINGATKVINMLQTQICPKCSGRKFVNNGICTHCNGKGELTSYKKFNVKIPAGIKDKSKIRLSGEGEYGKNGGKNGDLYITVNIKEPQNYKTEGLNILKTIPITPYEAVLGAVINIPTLKGAIPVKITPYTQNGQKIRLSGCGIVQNDNVGDMIITVEIRVPDKLSNEEIQLYKQLEQLSSHNIRDSFYDR